MLKFGWFAEAPIDFEHKNYVLLSYLKEIDESYSYHKLSPYLLYTEKLVQDMKLFKDNEWKFTNSLWTPIVSFSLQTGIRRREVQKGDEIVSKEEYERLWISDDEFLDDDNRGINNKEILRLHIQLR